jgi:hypothetical protein
MIACGLQRMPQAVFCTSQAVLSCEVECESEQVWLVEAELEVGCEGA